MKERIVCLIAIFVMIISLPVIGVSGENSITVYVNEKILQCDISPFVKDGRTMVPMRKIFEALEAKVEWVEETQSITATKGDTVIEMQIYSHTMYVNSVEETLDVAPVIVDSSTFVPIRAVSQSLDASVEWLEHTQTVYINSPVLYNLHSEIQFENMSGQMNRVNSYIENGMFLEAIAECNDAIYNHSVSPEDMALFNELKITAENAYNSYLEAEQNKKVEYEDMSGQMGRAKYYLSVGMYLEAIAECNDAIYNHNISPEDVKIFSEVKTTAESRYQTYLDEERRKAESSNNSASADNSPNTHGSQVYRTPKGKRYHFDKNCGGSNSYRINMKEALSAGLTPCQKCAW